MLLYFNVATIPEAWKIEVTTQRRTDLYYGHLWYIKFMRL